MTNRVTPEHVLKVFNIVERLLLVGGNALLKRRINFPSQVQFLSLQPWASGVNDCILLI